MKILIDKQPDNILLDFDDLSKAISSTIENTSPNYNIGIFGDWGTGKTTLLELVYNKISKNKDIIPVWFNSWRYQNEENIGFPIIHQIYNSILQSKDSKYKDFLDSLEIILSSLLKGIKLKSPIIEYDYSKVLDSAEKDIKSEIPKFFDPFTFLEQQMLELNKKGIEKK